MSALILILAVLAVSLVLAPLFVRQLRAERPRWARYDYNRKLAARLGGKVLVRNGIAYDILDVADGLVPKGFTYVLHGRWPEELDLLDPQGLFGEPYPREASLKHWATYAPLIQNPRPPFHFGDVS